jgi:hypothetical protein
VLCALGVWALADNNYGQAGVLIGVGLAVPVAQLLDRRRGGGWILRLPSAAIPPAVLTVAALAVGVCELAGFVFQRDIARGVLTLLAAVAMALGTFFRARKLRSRG